MCTGIEPIASPAGLGCYRQITSTDNYHTIFARIYHQFLLMVNLN